MAGCGPTSSRASYAERLRGDAVEMEVLEEANVRAAETIVAVTNDDETDIFASVLAKGRLPAGDHPGQQGLL